MLRIALKEFLQHSKESRDVIGQASKQAGKHLEGIQSEPCPEGACSNEDCHETPCNACRHQFWAKAVHICFVSIDNWNRRYHDIVGVLNFFDYDESRCLISVSFSPLSNVKYEWPMMIDDSGVISEWVRVNILWSEHVYFISSSDSPCGCTGEHLKEKVERKKASRFVCKWHS